MKVKLKDYQDFEKRFFDNEFPHQRFGQAFCTHFNLPFKYIANVQLYNENSLPRAMAMAKADWVEH
jgi:hypothetical protein